MYEPNSHLILESISDSDLVLDVGGWARPFNRANYVIDAEAYETRGFEDECGPPQGGDREFFSKATWFQRDICDKTPFPFSDKAIDFAICSHVLEDVRDPLWVCSELIRVAKRGYIEMPSRVAESSRGLLPGHAGWTHHRWLVEIQGTHLQFLMKYHMIHSHWRFSFPASHLRRLPPESQVQWLFWEDSFSYSEAMIHGVDNVALELSEFVQKNRPYPQWLLSLDSRYQKAISFKDRARGKLRRMFGANGHDG